MKEEEEENDKEHRTGDSFDLCKVEVRGARRLSWPLAESDPWASQVVGQAFLWHQIRCIVGVLFMVGSGDEAPDIIDQLLDLEAVPRKPQVQAMTFVGSTLLLTC